MSAKQTISSNKSGPHAARKIEKPWGHELIWTETADYVGKILFIKAGHSLSLQYHQIKEETIIVEEGILVVDHGPKPDQLSSIELKAGEIFHVPTGLIHRFHAKTDCRVYEVSTPQLNDVVRLQDNYGRT